MNHSLTILLVDDKVKTVGVRFRDGNRTYIYKTLEQNLKIGDGVVVEVGTDRQTNDVGRADFGIALAIVSELDAEPDFDNGIEYKWVVGTFNPKLGEEIREQEKIIVDKVKIVERQTRREQLREIMLGSVNIKKLPKMIPATSSKTTKKKGK